VTRDDAVEAECEACIESDEGEPNVSHETTEVMLLIEQGIEPEPDTEPGTGCATSSEA
jgi:hypothetical protein